MKKIEFAVNGKQSYYRCWGFPTVKPNVTLPLIVPLDPNGTITLTIDETQSTGSGNGSDIHFTSDQFEKDPQMHVTGGRQSFEVRMNAFSVTFDSKTGQILKGSGGTYVVALPDMGGAGNLFFTVLASSRLLDGNSPTFDLSNGLGCQGGLVLDVSLSDPNTSNPMFDLHIEAAVSREDVDGDGQYEVVCPAAFGVPVTIGEVTELVAISFGVTVDGGGIGILPGGRIIRIPPWGPPDPILQPIADGSIEIIRGLAVRDLVKDSGAAELGEGIGRLGLKLVEKGLEGALAAVRKVLDED
jgi:hypothetical protein